MITQCKQTYASRGFWFIHVFMSLFRSPKNSKGSLQLKLKGASAWPFNARNKVPTGWICDTWSLYRDTAVPAEGNGDLQTLICVFVARPRQCLTLSNPVPWQNWMVAYLGYTLLMRTLFRGWPIMVNDTHTRRRRLYRYCKEKIYHCQLQWYLGQFLCARSGRFLGMTYSIVYPLGRDLQVFYYGVSASQTPSFFQIKKQP